MTKEEKSSPLPCPFCGGEATLSLNAKETKKAKTNIYNAYCLNDNCLVLCVASNFTESGARNAWNTRANPSPVAEEGKQNMGEPHTEPKGEEAKRNECDCLRRPDSEGMPAGENPASPTPSQPSQPAQRAKDETEMAAKYSSSSEEE